MDNIFHRPEIATALAGQILQVSGASASASGLFLAAPRRTGKSTFLREDLRPELERQGALVLYADLWEDRKADPGEVIVNAVRGELGRHDGVVARLAKAAGMDKVNVAGVFTFSLDKVGLAKGVSLTAALAALSDATAKPIVLIIDEAQHAITSSSGTDALFALKAARDELNSSRHRGLRVVATGSSRDKLAMLRNSRDQAFYGAPLIPFPALDEKYVQWFCERARLPAKLSPRPTFELFKQASFRPEILGAAVDALRFDFSLAARDVPARMRQAVQEQIDASNAETLRVIHSLTPIQSAVLRVVAAKGDAYAPFEAATLQAYEAVVQATAAAPVNVSEAGVQQALVALQDKALVWRAARGVYALEEASLADLMRGEGMLDMVPSSTA